MHPTGVLIDYQTLCNQTRQRVYYQKLLAYYGGTFPMDYYRRVNRGLEAQRKLKAYWREKEAKKMTLDNTILPDNRVAFKRLATHR